VVLVGISSDDLDADADYLCKKIIKFRLFEDEETHTVIFLFFLEVFVVLEKISGRHSRRNTAGFTIYSSCSNK
jgi:hypothetical protein